jgi:hypothetical protein
MTDPLFDPTAPPVEGVVEDLLGRNVGAWHELLGRCAAMGAPAEWAWGGPKYGWEKKARRAGKPFATLTPHPNGFRALIVLGRADSEAAAALPLGPGVRSTYESARQLPDGRWLFHEVESDGDVADLVALLMLKLPPTIRARMAAAG